MGFPGHCPYLLQTPDGVLLMAHRVPETSLHCSLDEGRTWQGPVLIDHFIGAYPSLVTLRDGRILCVYYEEGARIGHPRRYAARGTKPLRRAAESRAIVQLNRTDRTNAVPVHRR